MVIVEGVPADRARAAAAAVMELLAERPGGDGLHVMAQRLRNGEWLLLIVDAATVEVVDAALSERIMGVLHRP